MKPDEPMKIKKEKCCNSRGGKETSKGNMDWSMKKTSREEKQNKKPGANCYSQKIKAAPQFYLTLGSVSGGIRGTEGPQTLQQD